MATPNPPTKSHLLTATYTSPTNPPFTYSQPLPSTPTPNPSTQERTTYLSSLRKAREILQEQINQELTMRMEEDNLKAAAAAAVGGGGKKGVDDGKEEENYGEEVIDED